jgi:hypothetical protein
MVWVVWVTQPSYLFPCTVDDVEYHPASGAPKDGTDLPFCYRSGLVWVGVEAVSRSAV